MCSVQGWPHWLQGWHIGPTGGCLGPFTAQVNRLFAFWGVGVVLAWGRGLPDD